MAIVIAISGKKGVGKTTLVDPYLTRRGFKRVSFAGTLKKAVRQGWSLTPEHTDGQLKEVPLNKLGGKTPRDLMISYGTLCRMYSDDELYFVSKAYDEIKNLPPDALVCIDDCRFKNESNYIREMGGIIIRLDRDPKLGIYAPSEDKSEVDLDDYDFDVTLAANKNRNPQDLERFADDITETVQEVKRKCKDSLDRFASVFSDIWASRH